MATIIRTKRGDKKLYIKNEIVFFKTFTETVIKYKEKTFDEILSILSKNLNMDIDKEKVISILKSIKIIYGDYRYSILHNILNYSMAYQNNDIKNMLKYRKLIDNKLKNINFNNKDENGAFRNTKRTREESLEMINKDMKTVIREKTSYRKLVEIDKEIEEENKKEKDEKKKKTKYLNFKTLDTIIYNYLPDLDDELYVDFLISDGRLNKIYIDELKEIKEVLEFFIKNLNKYQTSDCMEAKRINLLIKSYKSFLEIINKMLVNRSFQDVEPIADSRERKILKEYDFLHDTYEEIIKNYQKNYYINKRLDSFLTNSDKKKNINNIYNKKLIYGGKNDFKRKEL